MIAPCWLKRALLAGVPEAKSNYSRRRMNRKNATYYIGLAAGTCLGSYPLPFRLLAGNEAPFFFALLEGLQVWSLVPFRY